LKTRKIFRYTASLALMSVASIVFAQDQPAKPAAPEKAPAAADKSQDEAPVVEPQSELSVGILWWNLNGNWSAVKRYATPPSGLYLKDLSILSTSDPSTPFLRLALRGVPDTDFIADGVLAFEGGRGVIRARTARANYTDISPTTIPASSDHDAKIETTYALTPDLGLFMSYKSRAKDRSFEAPLPGIDSISNRYHVGVEAKTATGEGGVSFTGSTFNDHYGYQLDWTRNQVEAHYDSKLSDKLNVGGAYSHTKVKQIGYSDGTMSVFGVNAAFDLNEKSTLYFDYKREDFSFPIILNAYVQKRLTTGLGLSTNLHGHRLSLNYSHREDEHLDDGQALVEVPSWNSVNGRLTGKLSNWRYALSGSWEHFSKGGVTLDDPFSLFWDDRLQAQFRLFGGNEKFDWYASEGFHLNINSTRGTEIRSHELLFGGSAPIKKDTMAFFEVLNQSYVVQGQQDLGGYSLDEFFPTTTSIVAGLTKPLKSGTLDLTVNHTFTSYTNPLLLPWGNTRNTMFTARYQKRIAKDENLELSVSPWNFTDQLYAINGYRATVFGVSYGKKF